MDQDNLPVASHPWEGKQGRFSVILIASLAIFFLFAVYDGVTHYASFQKNCFTDPGRSECKNFAQTNLTAKKPTLDIVLDYGQGNYAIQVGAFTNEENARKVSARLVSQGAEPRIVKSTGSKRRVFYHVQLGRFVDQKKAGQAAKQLIAKGLLQNFVIAKYVSN